ncbi:hypothetical protein H6G97_35685 [Nostoc flagelliforme FACHB-838]|uniref:Nif11 domain-containing protein n=1 Tax=Nostoc flagelliforme FACHB-838 TaxID=2692904 RepID=A0ABR8DYN9_9NOSO|nr:hypothetical protein [Nostoc flagelliforme]MBD2534541.1 hypothetical protein [Nostoc flagelliforme FACHB-838]
MNNDQVYAQQLAQFAASQSFDERSVEFFDDVWQEAGVKDITKMTTADAESVLQVLGESEASPEFTKALLAQAITAGMPKHVAGYILESDRTLAQEIFNDGTSPFQSNQSSVVGSKQNQFQSSTEEDMEIQI